MKDNIESKNIGNRKFIIELRFDHKVILADKKGAIIERIKGLNILNPFHWEIGMANLIIFDNTQKEKARNTIIVELDRFSFICSKIDSIEGFYSKFDKIYAAIVKELGALNIRRIGCRIQGTYHTKSKEFNSVFTNIKSEFPAQFYLKKYPATDMLFQLNYQNGMYNIGPVKEKEDTFVINNFDESYRINHVGIAIDTDNYLTNEKQPINDNQAIKDIFILSLSVEKDLYSNLKEL